MSDTEDSVYPDLSERTFCVVMGEWNPLFHSLLTVPQRSVLLVILKFHVTFYFYADDFHIYPSVDSNSKVQLSKPQSCLPDIIEYHEMSFS